MQNTAMNPTDTTQYPPRIQTFRGEMIKAIPRVPNTRSTLAHLKGMHTRELILAYLTWRMRLIPAKPRIVGVWQPGVDPAYYRSVKQALTPFLAKVEAGGDLTPYLSDLVRTRGLVIPEPGVVARQCDQDSVLTRLGFHHFHVAAKTPGNPKGRSRYLLFAEVTEKEFTVVALSDHDAFKADSKEGKRFHWVCRSYIERDLAPGAGIMTNPVMSSGHSVILVLFSNQCLAKIEQFDSRLDDPELIDQLYSAQPIERDGISIARPAHPKFRWHFDDLRFGLLELKTCVFFCIFPFFTR